MSVSPRELPSAQDRHSARQAQDALIGREAELDALRVFVDQVVTDGAVLLISGDAGVGKTVLLDAAADLASAAGARVVRSAGVQFEIDISYSGLNQLLLPLLSGLQDLNEDHRNALMVALGLAAGAPPERLVVCTASLSLLRGQAAGSPLLLIIDDLPWLDRSSAGVLAFVARRLAGSRVGLLTASRTGERSYFDYHGLPEHTLRPLNDAAAADLMQAQFPEISPKVRRRLLNEAQGNPLALLELPSALNGPQLAALEALPDVLPLTGRLEALFASRIADLPAGTRDALLLSALEGGGDLRILRMAGDGDNYLDDLAPAEQARLVTVELASRRILFRHPLVRSAIVELSTNVERRRAHRALADLFIYEPERRAWHLAEASVEPDEEVAALLEQAAHRTLQRGDPIGAVAALTRAAHLSPGQTDQSRRLAEAAYLGADITGDLGVASRLLEDARRLDPQLGSSLHAAAAAAYILINSDGTIDTAHRLLVGAIESGAHGYDANNEELTEALHTLLLICWFAGRVEFWKPFYAALERLKPRAPEGLLVMSKAFPDTARTAAPVRARLTKLIQQQDTESEPNSLIRVNTSSVYLDLLGGCRASAWRVIESGRAGGAVRSSLGALMHLCLDDYVTGRWDEEQELADEGLATCRAHGYGFIIWYFQFHKALLAALRGADQEAQKWADDLTRVTMLRKAHGAARFAHHPRTLAAIGRGDYEAAYRHACDLSPAGTLAPYTPHALWVAMDLVEAAERTNRHAEALAHVQAMREADFPAISPRLGLLLAGASAIAAPESADLDLYEQALAMPGAEDWPFDHARIQLLYGERLRRVRAIAEARTPLSAALATFERLGAKPWATRARSELRATGQTRHRFAPGGAATAPLTAQEREIASLAAQGLSNKQIGERLFLSPRTVGSHLYRIFPKLGITSRAALRDALNE